MFIYLLGIFRIFTPFIAYRLNYDYIANVLCENKSKPKLQCNGKCHLKKELKKTAEEQNKKSENIKLSETFEADIQSLEIICPSREYITIHPVYHPYLENAVAICPEIITPPPRN